MKFIFRVFKNTLLLHTPIQGAYLLCGVRPTYSLINLRDTYAKYQYWQW